ncbi:MAG: lytic transglycosylase domain-containing protein [Actinomycetota bacterium]|nr:lytic transglycosylase domain-containing protein [Actinomycetota bacterium]
MRGLASAVPNAVLGGLVLVTGIVVVAASPPAPEPVKGQQLEIAQAPSQPKAASRSRALSAVRPAGRLRAPDILVTVPGRVTTAQVTALKHIRGVRAVSLVSRGRLRVDTKVLDVLGVDPSTLRGFTPRETAVSDALWAALHRGDLAVSYGTQLPLGRTVRVGNGSLRVGGLAAFGLPGDAVVDRAVGERLGLRADTVVLAAPTRSVKGLSRDVREALGSRAGVTVLRAEALVHRRPSTYRELYQVSARYCPGLSWTVLAAIGQVESGHGRNVGPSSAGALGPMQFMPATWAWARVDGDGDGKADIMSPYDAVPAAALYLCRSGAGHGGRALYSAIYSYNHADWYVRQVLALAARYR